MSIYNSKPNGKGLPEKGVPQGNGTSIYNKMMEGYIPPPPKEKAPYGLSKMGSVIELTLGDEKVIVHDPARLEGIINLVEKHEESIRSVRQSVKQLRGFVSKQDATLNQLKDEVQRLKDMLSGNNRYL